MGLPVYSNDGVYVDQAPSEPPMLTTRSLSTGAKVAPTEPDEFTVLYYRQEAPMELNTGKIKVVYLL
jgi:hypothetical protein